MKKKSFLFIATFFLVAGCGGSQSSNDKAELKSISAMEIHISPESVRVGMDARLFLAVSLDSGEEIDGLTTSFADPNTGESLPIEWSSSNESLAYIDEGSVLVPVSPGSVTVKVNLMGRSQSKTIRIFDAYSPMAPAPDESAPEDGTGTGDGTGTRVSCNGHAASVVSFSPGAGAGFGMDSLPDIVLGPPHGAGNVRGSTDVLSLGKYGEIVLDLGDCALVDGEGVDLIVFENAFFISGDPENPYAELGIVGVSENGVDYFEFPCEEDHFPYTGCAGWNPVYSSPSNGISSFDVANAGGDDFDLADIGVGLAHYVRIRDAGTEGFGTSVGFDLDAISVVNGVREAR